MQPFFRSQISVALLAAAIFPAAAQTIITFDVPGSTSTVPMSINSAGQIVGIYQDANRILHGFLRAPDGTITTLDPPPNKGTHTYDLRINGAGTIAGDYLDPAGNQRAFVRYANGAFTTIQFPSQIGDYSATTTAINSTGSVTGFVEVLNPFSVQGFVWNKGGTAIVFPFPGSNITESTAISSAGMTAGNYTAADTPTHGFLRTRREPSLRLTRMAVRLLSLRRLAPRGPSLANTSTAGVSRMGLSVTLAGILPRSIRQKVLLRWSQV